MKKIILSSVLAVAAVGANAASQSLCTGNPSNAVQVSGSSDGSTFVRVAFTPKCSNNVWLNGDDNQTYYRVGAASTKGKNYFGGSSVGGAVQPLGTCAATGCSASDAAAGVAAAPSS